MSEYVCLLRCLVRLAFFCTHNLRFILQLYLAGSFWNERIIHRDQQIKQTQYTHTLGQADLQLRE